MEPCRDRRDGRRVLVRDPEIGLDRRRAGDEQANGLVRRQRRGVDRALPGRQARQLQRGQLREIRWRGEARDRVFLLAGHAERRPGRDERRQAGQVAEELGDDRARLERPARSCRGRGGPACRPATPGGSSSAGRAPVSASPIVEAIREATRLGSRTVSSGTKNSPSGYRSAAFAATCSDSRVLPVPPGPVIVTRRFVSSSAPASASSRSRPTNEVSCVGRLFGRASSERSGGNSTRSPSATIWHRGCGSRRSFNRCRPRPSSVMSVPRSGVTSVRTASETTT